MAKQAHTETYDVLILGAGAAGLACAHELAKHNISFLIIEGRGRVGGRILTKRLPHLDTPIELGAEFIHGAMPATLGKLENAGMSFFDAGEKHVFANAGKLKSRDEFFEEMQRIMSKLDGRKDRTFAQFIEEEKPASSESRELAIAYVEGFHAGDTRKIGERGLKHAEQDDNEHELNGHSQFRVTNGYDRMIDSFMHGINTHSIKLSLIAKYIRWSKNSVEVECVSANGAHHETFKARAAVITLPIGVLKASAQAQASVVFDPQPEVLQNALAGIEMGSAMRVVFQFRSRFWEKLSEEPIEFLHSSPDHFFPTWWTTHPVRSPLLTAWQGGPKVLELLTRGENALVDEALKSLAWMTGEKLDFLYSELISWHFHDWDHDPFSLGGYSYIAKGGWPAAEAFAEPHEQTLFFAGEATQLGATRGTVNGAILSGERAAQSVLSR